MLKQFDFCKDLLRKLTIVCAHKVFKYINVVKHQGPKEKLDKYFDTS